MTKEEMDRLIKNFFTSHTEFSDFLRLQSKPTTQQGKDDLLKKCDEWLEKYKKYLDDKAYDTHIQGASATAATSAGVLLWAV